MGMIDDITIEELAWDAQGEWASVTEEFAPQWTHGYKRILAEIEGMREIKAYVAEIAQPAAPAQPATGGGADAYSGMGATDRGALTSSVVAPSNVLDMFLKGWLSNPLNAIYNGRDVVVKHDGSWGYNIEVDGRMVAGMSDGWFWRTIAEGQANELATLLTQLADANARAAALERALEPFAAAADCSVIKHKGRLTVDGREFILAVGPDSALFLHTDHLDAAKAAYKARQTAGE